MAKADLIERLAGSSPIKSTTGQLVVDTILILFGTLTFRKRRKFRALGFPIAASTK